MTSRKSNAAVFVCLFILTAIACVPCTAEPVVPDPNLPAVGADALYKDSSQPTEKRVADLISYMTLKEKIQMLGGDVRTHFDTVANDRLGIPMLSMGDGPHGLRWSEPSTLFPTSVTMASTWDPELIEKTGSAIAKEFLERNRNVLLGPCINLHRNPFGGRNFESFSEDPYLTGELAAGFIKGVRAENVIACAKHYAANNQEVNRRQVDIIVDERTLQEIYLPAFKTAVQKGGAWTVMAAYNKVLGDHACQNKYLLTDILKDQWGFDGFVMSDWLAVHSTVESANAGLDMEMPFANYFSTPLLDAVEQGKVSEATIDDKLTRIFRIMFRAKMFDPPAAKVSGNDVDSPEHRALALEVAREGLILLKNNNNTLPINRNDVKTIAVIGPNADTARIGGWGSSMVTSTYMVSPLEGIAKSAGRNVEVKYAMGCHLDLPNGFEQVPMWCFKPYKGEMGKYGLFAEYYNTPSLEGGPIFTTRESDIYRDFGMTDMLHNVLLCADMAIRWSGKIVAPETGEYQFSIRHLGQSAKLFIDGQEVVTEIPQFKGYEAVVVPPHIATVQFEAGKEYDIRVEYIAAWGGPYIELLWKRPGRNTLAEAAKLAAECDVAIVVVGLDRRHEGEGRDRLSLNLPGEQDELIKAVTKANPKTTVVLVGGTQVLMNEWLGDVPALIEAWYGGQESGTAIGQVLFGDFNPCGKMPTTFVKKWEDHSAYGTYPGDPNFVEFKEGIYIGYRFYDTKGVEPLFAFGHGLSYTTFKYSSLKISPAKFNAQDTVTVTAKVKNTGKVSGAEVVQLYVHDVKSSIDRPEKELKGFDKVWLKPGESKTVTFELDKIAFSFFDPDKAEWVAEPGRFEILLASSSRDIRLKGDVTLK